MQKLNSANFFILISLIIWFILLFVKVAKPQYSAYISSFSQILELVIHIGLISLNIFILRRLTTRDRKIFIWLLLTNTFFFINDTVFYFFIFIPNDTASFLGIKYSLFKLLLNNLPYFLWLFTLIIFLSKVLVYYILNSKLFLKTLLFLGIVNSILLVLFLLPINLYANSLTLSHNVFLITSIVAELIIFDLVILSLIYCKNWMMSLILIGFSTTVSGDLLITYCVLAKIQLLYSYGSLLWLLGMIFILLGTYNIFKSMSYDIKNWFRSNTGVKSQITFWSFCISSGSFLIFFILAGFFSITNKGSLISLPLFVMFYSIVIVLLSLFMGHFFETPFKQIENNIQRIISDDKTEIDNYFPIDEFVFLQDFLIKSFKAKEEQDEIRKKLGDLVASVAHDIGSPIQVMNSVMNNLKGQQVSTQDIDLLDSSLKKISAISRNLLNQYRDINEVTSQGKESYPLDDPAIPRYSLLSPLISQVIRDKKMEWVDNPCNIVFKEDQFSNLYWVKLSPLQFVRVISNLLNNAYESINKSKKNILIELSVVENKFKLIIQDNGIGIPQEKINFVLAGISLKHEGKGLGLSGAQKYFNSLNGILCLNSVLNVGTTIKITFPFALYPPWAFYTICYTNSSTFMILDDDVSVIRRWQHVLMEKVNVHCKYFTHIEEFSSWCKENADTKNVILLSEYHLWSQQFGADSVKKIDLADVYIFTSHAEELWMQEIAQQERFKLAPKSLIEHIRFSLNNTINI